MRNYNSPTMKPTMVVTNNGTFKDLDLGPVPRGKRRRAKTTTRRYTDSNGQLRYVGTSSLKESQSLALFMVYGSVLRKHFFLDLFGIGFRIPKKKMAFG